ncbi:flavin reductase family protein [Nocardia sp. NPDC058114]|uniref:flavin reductase family protein n=1 Tax=Nocardia sp. NPDC058114 TaxID=3346346 RepID=UPI0036DED9AF
MINLDELISDPAQLRQAFQCFPSGVAAICATVDGEPAGMAASTFTAVSIRPPLVSVCIQDSSSTWPRLRQCPRLGLSILAEGHDGACLSLSRKNEDRFRGVEWESCPDGSVFIHDSALWLDCEFYEEVPAGDHAIVLLRIQRLRPNPGVAPLVYHGSRFRRLDLVAS